VPITIDQTGVNVKPAVQLAATGLLLVIGLSGCSSSQNGEPLAATTGGESAGTSTRDFEPSSSNPDPTDQIDGVLKVYYPAAEHVTASQKVDYTYTPPLGGRHDSVWATCTGVIYPVAIRTENAVHSLEHGAVWITYNPDDLDSDDIAELEQRVDGLNYLLMSPYPGLDQPISLQSWGHQLKVTDARDLRIDQFITATRQNTQSGVYDENPSATGYPEPGATCATVPGRFDPADPPLFDPGPGTVPEG